MSILLNIVNIKVVVKSLTCNKLRVIHLGIELLHSNALICLVWRSERVEIECVVDCRLKHRDKILARNRLLAKLLGAYKILTLTLNEEHLLAVDEDTANQVTLIGRAVELERVREEVVDVDYTAIGIRLVHLNVVVLSDNMVGIEAKYVGMHTHNKQIRCDLELRLELTTIAILDTHSAVELSV